MSNGPFLQESLSYPRYVMNVTLAISLTGKTMTSIKKFSIDCSALSKQNNYNTCLPGDIGVYNRDSPGRLSNGFVLDLPYAIFIDQCNSSRPCLTIAQREGERSRGG